MPILLSNFRISQLQLRLQQVQQPFQLGPHLADDLLTLVVVFGRVLAGELLAGTGDGVALLVQQVAYLADQDDVVALVITAIATAFNRFQLVEFLFPVAKYM